MKQNGVFHTAYGVAVPVFEDPNNPDEFLFDMAATAVCMGLYEPADRRRFAEYAKATGKADFLRFGGHKPPVVTIGRPEESIYLRLPKNEDIPIEEWITLTLDCPRWADRADTIIRIIGQNFNNYDAQRAHGIEIEIAGFAIRLLVSACLEHLAEKEIDCLEAAAMYAISVDDDWQRAAVQWLKPFRKTWFKDWVAERPTYRRLAELSVKYDDHLPRWITGGRA